MEYRVIWVIDVEADSPEEAAGQALEIHRDKNSQATCFYVQEWPNGESQLIDLEPRK